LPTNDHISSNWTSHVRGGKSHELVVSVAGVLSGQLRQADDRIGMDVDEASGLSDAATLGEVLEHGEGLRLGEMGVEQGRPLALGEAGFAGLAVEQSDVVPLAVAGADGEISRVALAEERAIRFLATEARKIIHGRGSPHRVERDGIREWK
jgi:hypothetical protein